MKNIFITGASSGLGKSAAILLARRGHKVYASVHYEDQINSIKEIANSENLNIERIKNVFETKENNEKKYAWMHTNSLFS